MLISTDAASKIGHPSHVLSCEAIILFHTYTVRTDPATLTTIPSPKMEMTAIRWRAGNLRFQIKGIGRTVTRKSVKMLITLAEKTIAPEFMHW